MMTMRLAYRIASMAPMVVYGDSISRQDKAAILRLETRAIEEAAIIPAIPQFSFDNVAQHYAGLRRDEWSLKADIPNWAPPFPKFFAEWNEPAHDEMPAGTRQFGFRVDALDRDCFLHNEWQDYLDVLRKETTGLDAQADNYLTPHLSSARWIASCDEWFSIASKPLCGRPLRTGTTHLLCISDSGCLLASASLVIKMDPRPSDSDLGCNLYILGLGLSFCHCKNVRQETRDAGPPPRPLRNRPKAPRLSYYTLNIDPMRQTLRTEGRSDEVGHKRALHICRGHFATYTPDHPLFGKYVGTYWRPDHVRGNASEGAVVKDYSVGRKPGSP